MRKKNIYFHEDMFRLRRMLHAEEIEQGNALRAIEEKETFQEYEMRLKCHRNAINEQKSNEEKFAELKKKQQQQ